jgi:poly-gamma-glutamate capsule biosynthesis protein CapA/YwtB (metallophosphatase superfamily)
MVALATGGLVGTHLATAKPPPVRTVQASATAGTDGRFTLQFVGDTMLGDGAERMIWRRGYDRPFNLLRGVLDGDYVIANAEGAITATQVPYNRGKEYFYAARPEALAAMRRAGIDALGLANNHAMDAGPRGVRDGLQNARDWGLTAFGAGRNRAQAERPLMLDTPAGTIAVVGLGESFGSAITADLGQAGTVALDPASVQRGIDLAHEAGADKVVALVHWGDNYMPVNREQRYWARMLALAGYDLVVGAGPHIAQPVEMVHGTPVVFSLGNYVFGSPGRFDTYGQRGVGLVLDVGFGAGEDPSLSFRCVRTDNEAVNYRPHLCNRQTARRALGELSPMVHLNRDGSATFRPDAKPALQPVLEPVRRPAVRPAR